MVEKLDINNNYEEVFWWHIHKNAEKCSEYSLKLLHYKWRSLRLVTSGNWYDCSKETSPSRSLPSSSRTEHPETSALGTNPRYQEADNMQRS